MLNCKGICRVDYILTDDVFHLLEINTIPGMTEQSFIPQQVAAMGEDLTEILNAVIEEAFEN